MRNFFGRRFRKNSRGERTTELKNNLSTFFVLTGLCSLPVFGYFNYSNSSNLLSLASSLTFIIIFPMAAMIISSRLPRVIAIIANILIFLVIFSSETLRFVSFYLQGEGFNERFFFHFTLGTIKNASFNYPALAWSTLLLIALIVYFAIRISYKNPFKQASISVALISIITSPLLNSAIRDYSEYQWNLLESQSYDKSLTKDKIDQLGLNSDAAQLKETSPARPGRNLVLIYLESLEAIYSDNELFESLTPNINSLKRQGAFFSDIRAFPGTEWTIAGILSSQCGTPLLYENRVSGNDILASGFLSNATCLSDVLHKAGYRQVFLGGATHKFAGKGEFLRNHHYDEVNGLDELLSSQADQSYRTSWGLYDDSLFDIAVNKFNELAMQDNPFNLTLLTLDTHHPTGHASQSCKPYPYIDNSMLHAVHCTDQLLNDFLEKISHYPAFKKTTVVLLSDHLAMRNVAEEFYPPRAERKNTFIVINSDFQGEVSTTGTSMDIAPTILDLLDVEHHTSFLAGSSMLKRKSRVDFTQLLDSQTLTGIRKINSSILSSSSGLCKNGALIIKHHSNNSLLIGDRKLSLSYAGNTFDSAYFEDNISFKDQLSMIIFFNHLKEIKHAFVVEKYEIPYLASEYSDLDYILINSNGVEVNVWFGRNNKLRAVDSFGSLGEIDIHIESCDEVLDKDSPGWTHLSNVLNYEYKCQKDGDRKHSAEYRSDNRILSLPNVRVYGYKYSFELIKDKKRSLFILKDYKTVQNKRISQYDPCMPAYFQDTLFIPQLKIANKSFSVRLKLSTENSTHFMINKDQEVSFE